MPLPNLKTPPLPGFPAEAESTRHRNLLDRIADGSEPEPACVRSLGLPRMSRWSPGLVECEVTLDDDLCWVPGVVFGGFASCLADQFAGLAMLSVLPDNAGFLTAGLDIRFQAPLAPGKVLIQAIVAELAERQAIVDVGMKQRDRVRVQAKATQIIIKQD